MPRRDRGQRRRVEKGGLFRDFQGETAEGYMVRFDSGLSRPQSSRGRRGFQRLLRAGEDGRMNFASKVVQPDHELIRLQPGE